MSIFSISDIHLPASGKSEKSMDIFGERWRSHREKIEKNWRLIVSDDDTVILPGDISWAKSLDEAKDDFIFIDSLPGKKIIGKGNHDYWWSSLSKMNASLSLWGCGSVSFLRGGAVKIGNDAAAMTCGKFPSEDEDAGSDEFTRLSRREAGRLKSALADAEILTAAGGRPIVFLHYPAALGGVVCRPILDVILSFGVRDVYYGHIHGKYNIPPVFEMYGVRFHIVSADAVGFSPILVSRQ